MAKAVFFDWFNTLAEYSPPREEVQARASWTVGIEVEKEKLSPGILLADHYYIEENLRHPVRNRSLEEQMALYIEMQRIVMRQVGVNPSDKLASPSYRRSASCSPTGLSPCLMTCQPLWRC